MVQSSVARGEVVYGEFLVVNMISSAEKYFQVSTLDLVAVPIQEQML